MLVSRFALKDKITGEFLVHWGFESQWSASIIEAYKWEKKPENLIKRMDNVKLVLVTVECKEQPWEVKV